MEGAGGGDGDSLGLRRRKGWVEVVLEVMGGKVTG